MKFEQAFEVVDKAFSANTGRHLNDVELMVLRGSCEGLTYDEMAERSGYGVNYLKGDAGHKFWKLLSKALGEQVGKRNFQAALERAKGRFSVAGAELAESADALGTEKPDQEQKSQGDKLAFTFDFYVERPPIEKNCYDEIKRPGALIRIKAPRQMGKTLLMDKIFEYAGRQGYQTVLLNFLQAERDILQNLDKFLRWFCANVGRRLQQCYQPEDWDKGLGSNANCTIYFEECLLANRDYPLVLALDNMDRVFQYDEQVAINFLNLLRSWHEEAKIREIWKRLRLVLVLSTEVEIPLQLNQSAFNVGLAIDLPEFTAEQIRDLSKRHEINLDSAQLDRLISMVGGHPYLVDKALTYMKYYPNTELERLLQEAPTEAGLYDNHLREHLLILHKEPELAAAMKEVVDAPKAVRLDSEKLFKLESMGLLRLEENDVKPRCELYRLYFKERLKGIRSPS